MKTPWRSKQLRSRLTAYSATAAAALTAAPAANAEIHNITDGLSGNLLVNGSHTATPTLNFFNKSAGLRVTAGPIKVSFNAFNSAHTFAAGYLEAGKSPFAAFSFHGGRTVWYPRNIDLNLRISTHGPFQAANTGNIFFLGGGGIPPTNPQFQPVGANAQKTGYLGFKTHQGTHNYYGWLRLRVQNSAGGWPDQLSLVDKSGDGIYGAFGLASDQIKAGEVALAPEPSVTALMGLGLLALGATGVRELRRRKLNSANA